MTANGSYPCPVCGGTMVPHANDNHIVCPCGYYTNIVFAQYFIQTERELEVRDEQKKEASGD